MSQVSRDPVVIDTGVFGAQLTRRTWPLGESYRPLVEGGRHWSPSSPWQNCGSVPGWPGGDRNGCEGLIAS